MKRSILVEALQLCDQVTEEVFFEHEGATDGLPLSSAYFFDVVKLHLI
jgi:hypothetical protein